MVQQPGETRPRWTDPDWRRDAEDWVRARVAELGGSVAAIEQPHVRPWGTVFRVSTDAGTLWFKAAVAAMAFEPALLQLLGDRRPDAVPRLLAADRDRIWMLMEDAGVRLHHVYADDPPLEVWEDFVARYAQLQLELAPSAEQLIRDGVPDNRSTRAVDKFVATLEDDWLMRELPLTPPTEDELARVRALEPRLRAAVAALDALGLPDSIQHDDLHAWNVCVHDGDYRFIDWGDSCVGHPLGSLGVPLWHLPDQSEAARARVRDAYLEPWTHLAAREELRAAADAAVLVAHMTGVLKWTLLHSHLAERGGYEDVIPERLRELLAETCA